MLGVMDLQVERRNAPLLRSLSIGGILQERKG